MAVAALYVRADSVYKTMPDVEAWDEARDARNYDGPWPVVAHPPCRAWGRLRAFAKPAPWERNLGRLAVAQVRAFGGVLEHPATSLLWRDQGLPIPGAVDCLGGWTMEAPQFWWGHQAEKRTWFYIVGCRAKDVPEVPFVLGQAPCVVGSARGTRQGRKEITKSDRERTPVDLARWLVELASRAHR